MLTCSPFISVQEILHHLVVLHCLNFSEVCSWWLLNSRFQGQHSTTSCVGFYSSKTDLYAVYIGGANGANRDIARSSCSCGVGSAHGLTRSPFLFSRYRFCCFLILSCLFISNLMKWNFICMDWNHISTHIWPLTPEPGEETLKNPKRGKFQNPRKNHRGGCFFLRRTDGT